MSADTFGLSTIAHSVSDAPRISRTLKTQPGGVCKTGTVCGFYSQNYAPGGFNFRALLTEGCAERLELARA